MPGDEVPGGHDGRCVPAPWQLNLELRAECVVDLILGRAPQVSGKFLVYRAALEGSMAVAVVSSDTGTLGIHTPAQPSPAASSVIEYSHSGSEGAGTGHIWSGIHTLTLLNYMKIFKKICKNMLVNYKSLHLIFLRPFLILLLLV